ncbi:hypothetical protein Poli38472_005664 [Pythium oligandrum]|uniref:ODAD1 central coiled coil region domain-containing protein n=1 Tax=Pythium oligandrum TaxID=41045 RepID=A0A8K1FHT1_PYTOL|nr:hypothetical protein Poli38472_005664 [Pythium oligandrum]|eukprot:TMW63046.1 hypothetical protein Poli38472_005664 [Pythium oligandrum]
MAKSNARAESDQLFKLQIQGDKYARLLMEQKQRLRQLDAQYRKVHEELKELRLKRGEGDQRGGGANAVRARLADEQRELMKLENRLSACRTRESKMLSANAELRQRVDALRAGRVLSQNVFDKNQKRLREIQRLMQDCFRSATQIMAERDRIAAQACAMTASNTDEQESFDSVFQNLAAIIKREKENAEAYRKQVLEQDPLDLSDDYMRGDISMEEEQKLKKTLQRLDSTLKDDKQAIETINEKLLDFESTFKVLQEQMGVDDCHDILAVYTKREEENFALFRYVQSLNNEIEQLEDDKHRLEQEKEKLQVGMKDGSAHARKRMIDDLVETRQRIVKENGDYERLRASALREFQPIARAVDRLYNALGCNDVVQPNASSGSSTGDTSKRTRKQSDDQMAMMARINSMNDLLAAHGITEGNILQFLAIIEQRSNELIEQFSERLQYKNPMEFSRASLGANLRPSDPSRAVVAARAIIFDANNGPANPSGPPISPVATNVSNNASVENPHAFDGISSILGSMSPVAKGRSTTAIAEEETGQSSSDEDDDEDHPMSTAELQKRAAKSFAGLQMNPKVQVTRGKPVMPKKKK